jgi:hypothetical protein
MLRRHVCNDLSGLLWGDCTVATTGEVMGHIAGEHRGLGARASQNDHPRQAPEIGTPALAGQVIKYGDAVVLHGPAIRARL